MQEDMHFYGTYAMARAAGLEPDTARTIAWAAQFVDDALEGDLIGGGDYGVVLPIMTSHKPIDYHNAIARDQWEVWVCFHFLPGLGGGKDASLDEKLVCTQDSATAKKMLNHAIKFVKEPYGPHLAGIAAHVYADTFSHFGFAGVHRDWNRVKNGTVIIKSSLKQGLVNYLESKFQNVVTRVKGSMAEAVPVGHGSVGTYPDRPYLHWEYEYEWHPNPKKPRPKVVRDNTEHFLDGCQALHVYFRRVAKALGQGAGVRKWSAIAGLVADILKLAGDKAERIERWLKEYERSALFDFQQADMKARYSESAWQPGRIIANKARKRHQLANDGLQFIKAARVHRAHVLGVLLKDLVII